MKITDVDGWQTVFWQGVKMRRCQFSAIYPFFGATAAASMSEIDVFSIQWRLSKWIWFDGAGENPLPAKVPRQQHEAA